MRCAYHPDREPIGMCIACGRFVCVECKAVLGGKIYCTPCADKIFVHSKPETTQVEQAKPTAPAEPEVNAETHIQAARTEEPSTRQSDTTIWKKVGLSRRVVVAYIVVLVVAAAVGAIMGFVNGITTTAGLNYPSTDQLEVINKQGKPSLWLLSDGPVKPGGEIHRVESWLYPGSSTQFNFMDGKLVGKENLSLTAPVKITSPVNPSNLSRDMTLQDVQQLLGETGKPIATFKSTLYPGNKAYQFTKNRLLVSFLGGKLFITQTY